MSEIVERLRKLGAVIDAKEARANIDRYVHTANEAAAEIERLEARVRELDEALIVVRRQWQIAMSDR